MASDPKPIRDFLYLDMERVRSFIAQVYEGVPESVKEGSGSDSTVSGGVEGSIPFLLKGKAGADLRYFRSQDETRSLHHHLYTLLERHLEDAGRLRSVDSAFAESQWSPTCLRDGEIVRVAGHVRVIDYASIADTVREMPKFATLVNQVVRAAAQGAGASQQGQRQRTPQADLGMSPKDFTAMSELIQRMHGESVRVKVVPSLGEPSRILSATAPRAYFGDSLATVQHSYGFDLAGSWSVVGQINGARDESGDDSFAAYPTGNEMEDALEKMVAALDGIRRVSSGFRYPCISMNLIAIFREF